MYREDSLANTVSTFQVGTSDKHFLSMSSSIPFTKLQMNHRTFSKSSRALGYTRYIGAATVSLATSDSHIGPCPAGA
jgi:hypothetical protein